MESGPKSSQTDGHWSQKRGGVGGVNPGCVWRGMPLGQRVGPAWPWVPAVVPDHLVALGKALNVFELQFCCL